MKQALLALAVIGFGSTANSDDARLCHTANAGFFIDNGTQSVLIDTVIKQGLEGYDKPSDRFIADIEGSKPPFDKAKVVLVTHYHADHFDPASTIRHMKNNPDTRYILPPQAFSAMDAMGISDKDKSRIHTPLPAMDGQKQDFSFDSINIEVFRVSHGVNRPIENLGYRFSFENGPSFFHPGDISTTSEQLSAVGIEGMEVDYLLIPFWVGGDETTMAMAEKAWKPKHIIPMHFQSENRPWMEQFGGPNGVKQNALNRWDNSIDLTGEMQCEGF